MLYLAENIRQLSPHVRLQLAFSQLLVLLPFVFLLPPQISLLIFLAPFWVFTRLATNKNSQLNRFVIVGICILVSALVFLQYNTFRGKDAGVALITAMYSLKILESWRYRDFNLLITLSFFISAMAFLFSQSFLLVGYIFVVYGRLLHTLTKGNAHQSSQVSWRQSSKLILYAIPIIAVLFVFFPRLSEPLWRMPGQLAAGTGLSDSMTPGDINALNLLDDPAFRVKVADGQMIPAERRYWRGLVFENFNGLTWQRDPLRESIAADFKFDIQNAIQYTVTYEASQQPWLVGLDVPILFNGDSFAYSDGTIRSPKKIRQRVRYQALSVSGYSLEKELSPIVREMNLALPEEGNTQARQWAIEQRSLVDSDADFIAFLMRHINQEPYFYTLTPPIMNQEMVDDFWFNRRSGFCEHYASSVAFILRAANIPARVVTGYHGGEYNELGEYYLVRQWDAHAWVEYWQADTGWQRLDPTAAIATFRIDDALLAEVGERGLLFDQMPDADPLSFGLFEYWQQWSDSVNNFWNEWVIDFSSDTQVDIFNWLNLSKMPRSLVYILVLATVALMIFILSRRLIFRSERVDSIAKSYRLFLRKLRRRDIHKRDNEGPDAFMHRVLQRLPEQREQLLLIHQQYMNLRYRSERIDAAALKRFKRSVAQF
ncbi:MAG: DUF3488 domain-containing transglutaminase family protein [Gammaproteobacteria bacterium]|nr:DUF3488 domain-containing transglutaminase family protein [Gammaproteobacteria bacterium]